MILTNMCTVLVFVGILFTMRIDQVYLGEYISSNMGMGFNPILWMVIIGASLFLGDYLSKDIHPRLNRILKNTFGWMICISIVISVIL